MKGTEEKGTSVARELLEAMGLMDRAYHQTAHRYLGQGQRQGQAFLLFVIKKHGTEDESGIRISDLAARLRVTASNITQMVTDLEEKGLVERRMDPSDRRAVKVSLTPEGARTVEEVRKPFYDRMDDLARFLGEEKARAFIGLLEEAGGFLGDDGEGAFTHECAGPRPFADPRAGADRHLAGDNKEYPGT